MSINTSCYNSRKNQTDTTDDNINNNINNSINNNIKRNKKHWTFICENRKKHFPKTDKTFKNIK